MPRSQGSITYIEHRSPMKDETGKYLVHPQFVYRDVYDFKDMKKGMRHHSQMNPSQFVTAISAIEDETLLALSQGMEVRIGDMFVIRPKLEVRRHKDEKGKEWRKVYHEGDLIPADEVACTGLEVRATKAFTKAFLVNHCGSFSRNQWKVKFPGKEAAKELLDITNYCKEHGFITVHDFIREFGVSKYHAQKVLNGYCEGEFPKMTKERVGNAFVYRLSVS